MKRIVLLLSFVAALAVLQTSAQIARTGTNCTGTTSCTPTNATGDLQLAFAFRDGNSAAPTMPAGWTSVGTASINGTGSADSAAVLACKVSTGANEASGTFTNANALVVMVYTGNKVDTTANCATNILGTPSFFTSTVNTTTTTETFNSVTNSTATSWDVGFGGCSACTAGIGTAPTGMSNRSSVTGPPGAGGHDTNAMAASYSTANVTLTTAGRIITVVVEIKAQTFISAATGNLNAGATWVGGVAPSCTGGETLVIAPGHAVTANVNCTLGNKSAAGGDAVLLQGTNASTYGELIVPSGVTLTLRGFDKTANRLAKINQYGKLTVQSGGTVSFDVASDYQSIIKNDGHFVTDGGTFTIPSGNVNWNNASGTRTVSGVTSNRWYAANNIWIYKLDISSKSDPGPIANAAGTALGSRADTSISITSGGFQGTTSVEKDCGATIATIADNLTTNGDYCIDYQLAIVWYKASGSTLTITYSFKYATWFSYGIISSANTTGSSMLVDNSTFNYCGWHSTSATETDGGCLMADNKFAPTLDSARAVRFTGNTFNNAARAIDLKCTNTATTSTDVNNRIFITGNAVNYARFNSANFLGGWINLGYCRYVTIGTTASPNTLKTFAHFFSTPGRGTSIGLLVQSNTGAVNINRLLTSTSVGSTVERNIFSGWSGTADVANIEYGGDATNGPNIYQDNVFSYAHRAARLNNYMTVRRNDWSRTYHHGAVHASAGAYIDNYTWTNNVIRDSFISANDFAGGWTLGYNQSQWIRNVTIANNTFDNGLRCINFNDQETTVVLGTKLKILNNICSNSVQGIYQPANTSTNVSAIQLTRLDYNNDYNNTTTPTNRAQATFMRSSAEYNEGTRNITAGVQIFAPSGYSLPDATGRTLELVASGTSGTDKALNLTWGGGTAVNLVEAQGTATSATTTTLTNSGASFTTSGSGLKTFQVCIASGTGTGQCAMITANTATQLTILSNTSNGQWTVTPDSTSVYVVLKSQVTLTDSGGTNSVQAGVDSPTISLTNGTFTDSGITIDTHAFNVDPQYVNAAGGDMRPQNVTLDAAGSDGSDIGALSVLLATGNAAGRRSHRRR